MTAAAHRGARLGTVRSQAGAWERDACVPRREPGNEMLGASGSALPRRARKRGVDGPGRPTYNRLRQLLLCVQRPMTAEHNTDRRQAPPPPPAHRSSRQRYLEFVHDYKLRKLDAEKE